MFEIDLSNVEVNESNSKSYEPLPAGDYELYLTDADIRDSKAGNKYIKAEFTVASGEYERRKVFENFTLSHEVGLQRLKTMALCMGVKDFKKFSPQKLIGKKVLANVFIKTDAGYDPKNAIKTFISVDSQSLRVAKSAKSTSADEVSEDELPF